MDTYAGNSSEDKAKAKLPFIKANTVVPPLDTKSVMVRRQANEGLGAAVTIVVARSGHIRIGHEGLPAIMANGVAIHSRLEQGHFGGKDLAFGNALDTDHSQATNRRHGLGHVFKEHQASRS